jgi:uncharacterized Zn finger protein
MPTDVYSTCEKCQQGTGMPMVVATLKDDPKRIRITVRCDHCGHMWNVDRESAVELTPKVDRRKSSLGTDPD